MYEPYQIIVVNVANFIKCQSAVYGEKCAQESYRYSPLFLTKKKLEYVHKIEFIAFVIKFIEQKNSSIDSFDFIVPVVKIT